MTNSIIFVDPSVQDYQSLIHNIDRAKIVILNDNFRVFFARDQALIIFDRRINKNNLPSHK